MEIKTSRRFVRFYKYGFRKAECGICHGLIPKRMMEFHARWHAKMGEGDEIPRDPTVRGFIDFELFRYDDGTGHWHACPRDLGWRTSGAGAPR